MLYLVIGSLILTAVGGCYMLRTHRMLDTEIKKGVELKVSTNALLIEIVQLTEERQVTHNLLRDFMENEALLRHATSAMPDDERVRLIQYRKDRRLELFGESLAVLGEIKPVEVKWRRDARVS